MSIFNCSNCNRLVEQVKQSEKRYMLIDYDDGFPHVCNQIQNICECNERIIIVYNKKKRIFIVLDYKGNLHNCRKYQVCNTCKYPICFDDKVTDTKKNPIPLTLDRKQIHIHINNL